MPHKLAMSLNRFQQIVSNNLVAVFSCSTFNFLWIAFSRFSTVAAVVVMILSWQGHHFVGTVSPVNVMLAMIKNSTVLMRLTLSW